MARTLPRSASEPPLIRAMTILLAILALTLALAWRARVLQRWWNPAEADGRDENGLVDACTRASLLVLMSLIGLFGN